VLEEKSSYGIVRPFLPAPCRHFAVPESAGDSAPVPLENPEVQS